MENETTNVHMAFEIEIIPPLVIGEEKKLNDLDSFEEYHIFKINIPIRKAGPYTVSSLCEMRKATVMENDEGFG
jgi:hypothetical protein